MGSGKSKEKPETARTTNQVPEKQNQEKIITKSNTNVNNNKNDTNTRNESRVNGHITDRKENSEEHRGNSQTKKQSNDNNKDRWNDDDLDLDNAWVSNNTNVIETNKTTERTNSDLEEEMRLNEFNKKRTMELERLERAKQEHYPESYAQKNMRQQYTTELLRQKTMYRNPDDWEEDEDIGDNESFDVSRFKQANRGTTKPQKDIFGNEDMDYTKRGDIESSYDYSYGQTNTHRKNVPKYDISEEELMADIEKDLY